MLFRSGLVETTRDGYLKEGKRFVTVAIGCTGGRHRSVALAEELVARLSNPRTVVGVTHRDVGKD